MYRVLAVIGGSLVLAACSSTPSWLNLDALKPEPIKDTVQFESEPVGAEAKTSTGQTCRTPCSLDIPANAPLTVTFTLNGYLPATEQVELVSMGDGTSRLRPNPVQVELTPAPPPPKPKKPTPKKKSMAKPKTAAQPVPAAAARTAAPAASTQTGTSPWPAPQPAR